MFVKNKITPAGATISKGCKQAVRRRGAKRLAPKPCWPECPLYCGAQPTESTSGQQSPPAADAVRERRAGRTCAQSWRSREKQRASGTSPTFRRTPSFHQPQIGSYDSFHLSCCVATATRRPVCKCSLRVFSRSFLTKVQKGQLIYYKTLVSFLSIPLKLYQLLLGAFQTRVLLSSFAINCT